MQLQCNESSFIALLALADSQPSLTDGSQLAGQEVIGRPGAADQELTILELFAGRAVTVLIFQYGLGINEVGDINEHAVGVHLLATDFFFEWIEELVNLSGQSARFGLAFAVAGSLLAELGQVLTADGGREFHINNSGLAGISADDKL